MNFKTWLEQKVVVPVQSADQKSNYDCGPAALRAITKLFGKDQDQDDLIRMTDAGKRKGTHPENIVKTAHRLGMQAIEVHNMTLEQLLLQLRKGRPVICAIQAWGNKKDYHKAEDGHYVVAMGYSTKEKMIYFQDPSMHNGKRGKLSFDEFMQRWHDKEAYQQKGGKPVIQLGIVIWDSDAFKVEPNFKTKAQRIP